MLRNVAGACALFAFVVLAGSGTDADAQQAKKNQMVKGTVKTVDASKKLLVVSQKVKNENVDRELSILDSSEFVIIDKSGAKKEAVGRDGLAILESSQGAVGSAIQVKCDKDVNVLKVTVTIKK